MKKPEDTLAINWANQRHEQPEEEDADTERESVSSEHSQISDSRETLPGEDE